MDSDKIINLLDIEVDILKYYNELCQMETMMHYDNGYNSLVNLLKTAIKKQNEILDTLSIVELLSSSDEPYKEYLKNTNNQIDIEDVMARMSIITTNKLASIDFKDQYAVLNREQIGAKYIVMGESTNIQLSFIDEYLSQVNDLSVRKMLCCFKYFLIYVMGTTIEEQLMENLYHTNKSVYLTSYLEARLRNIPLSYIDESRKEFATIVFNNKYKELYRKLLLLDPRDVFRYSFYAQDLLKSSIIFRTDLLLLGEKDFLETLNVLNVNKDNPWYKVFLSDRERHKTVTLGQGRTR